MRIRIDRYGVRVGKSFSVILRRTLRVPDVPAPSAPDSRGSLLPPNLGALPLHRVEEYSDRVPREWLGRHAAFAPLRQREALWLDFQAASPHAVKVGVGGVDAITGRAWNEALESPQNYLVCPPQEWLDGVRTSDGKVRQFVAMPLGEGYSVAAQVAGTEQGGGIQILVFGPKRNSALKSWRGPGEGYGLESMAPRELGVAVGGEIAQRIHPDPYGIDIWDQKNHASLTIYLVEAGQYREWTGLEPPFRPPTAADYTAAGLPWFERLDEAFGDLASPPRGQLRSVAELDRERGSPVEEAARPVSVKRRQVVRVRVGQDDNQKEAIMVSPNSPQKRKEKALSLLPDLGALNEALQENPDRAIVLPDEGPLAETGGDGFESASRPRQRGLKGESEEVREERQRVIDAGKRAIVKLNEDRDAALTREEQTGFEAIVLLVGRPALLVQGGSFSIPPDEWSVLNRPDVRPRIGATVQGVGRIEVTNHPAGLDWIGTGFLVAEDVVMTNRHVAVEFARLKSGKTWEFQPGLKASIDYVEEFGAQIKAEFRITEIIGIHDEVDLALLRVARRGSPKAKRPQPLSLAANPKLKAGRQVYVVGYPAADSRRNDPVEMLRIFQNIFDVKRLQPGKVMKLVEGGKILNHDCSTLGGNSGSCVVDLETHQVVGLHFGGRYLVGNSAVVLSKLVKDPLVKKAKLEFV